jgi:cation diffusion facilitator CzcD-associated flavoprotein CzcO
VQPRRKYFQPVKTLRRLALRYQCVVECGERRFEADRVVVATGFYGKPSVPELASELDARIVQMHSSEYRW